jgi:DNA mismatch repair protein MutL
LGNIRILEDHLVNQIAAGEVIERPAAVVKELVENALDAESRTILVRLKSGGRQLIEVQDDGVGMDRDDALMCLERHGTSKIRSAQDLHRVDTLGFRGEALPSIASVCRFELVTRRAQDEVGTRIVINGGRLEAPEPVACAQGVRISARQLFFNLPARRKFLRTIPTELGHCVEAVVRQALVNPQVDFTVEHDGRVLLRAPRVEDSLARAADLLGEHGKALFEAKWQEGPLEIRALLSPVGVHQASPRGSMYLYVNGRFVTDAVVRRAVRDAYRHIVPKGRYPVGVVDVRLPPEHVDVNVHPTKIQVRFRHARDLERAVADGLRRALEDQGIRRNLSERAREPVHPPTPNERLPLAAPVLSRQPSAIEMPVSRQTPAAVPLSALPPMAESSAPVALVSHGGLHDHHHSHQVPSRSEPIDVDALLPVPRFQDLRVIGQFARTYVLCEGGGEMVLIDQHAAHERVQLHRLQKDAAGHLGAAQRLLTPILVELPPAQAAILGENLEVLAAINLEVEPFDAGTFAIRAVPGSLEKVDLGRLITDIANDLSEGGRGLAGRDLTEHLLATMACHNSIRGHQDLTPYLMRELLQQLDEVDFGVCAHGRPVAIRISEAELERRFHRSG